MIKMVNDFEPHWRVRLLWATVVKEGYKDEAICSGKILMHF
jgi:hypothetical protein